MTLVYTSLPTSTVELCPTQVVPDPTSDTPDATSEPILMVLEAPASPASSETSMPPLDGPEDLDEMEEEVDETQGVVCVVAPTPKVGGNH